ncbi:MAG: flagellar biosynthesis protein FlgJ [Clostridiaceae bacterium]|jgi:flagellar protein FlgJ|nr:flagellar biosynthesis protein FlgJ [Clostridiaceae bacterium]
MDINMIDGMTMGNFVRNAANQAARASDDDFARRLEEAARNKDDRELKKACQEFEAIMLDMLFRQMKATIIKSGLVEEDPGREIFETMLDEELMEQASKRGSLGLADMLYKQLSRQYGISPSPKTSENSQSSGASGEE